MATRLAILPPALADCCMQCCQKQQHIGWIESPETVQPAVERHMARGTQDSTLNMVEHWLDGTSAAAAGPPRTTAAQLEKMDMYQILNRSQGRQLLFTGRPAVCSKCCHVSRAHLCSMTLIADTCATSCSSSGTTCCASSRSMCSAMMLAAFSFRG